MKKSSRQRRKPNIQNARSGSSANQLPLFVEATFESKQKSNGADGS
jgi:hypothetical protein